MEQKPAMKGTKTRQTQLQFIRFLAFLNVFILHGDMWNCFSYPAWNGGLSAVNLFFILSGLLTGYNGRGREAKPTLSAIGRDMVKKVKKIYPLYFLTMVYAFLASENWLLILNRDLAGLKEPLVQLMKNLLLIQCWFPEGYFSYNGVGWFCGALMFLNLFNLPLVFLLNRIGKKKNAHVIIGGLFVACLVGTVAYCYVTRSSDFARIHFLQYICPLARVGEYLAAAVLGFALRGVKEQHQGNKTLFTLLEIAALVFWCAMLLPNWNGGASRIVVWLLPNFLLLGVFLLGWGGVSQLFRLKPLVRLGDVSFECFLLHNLMYTPFVAGGLSQTTFFGCIAALMASLLLTLLVSFQFNKGK